MSDTYFTDTHKHINRKVNVIRDYGGKAAIEQNTELLLLNGRDVDVVTCPLWTQTSI